MVERSKQDTPGSTNCFWPPQGRILRTLSTIELEIEKVSHWVACGQSYSLYQLYPYCKWAALLLTLDYIIQVTLPLFAPLAPIISHPRDKAHVQLERRGMEFVRRR